MNETPPRIALVAAGGRIGLYGRHRLDLAEYADFGRFLEPNELLERVPELQSIARLELVPFKRVVSSAMRPDDWIVLGRALCAALEQASGAVVLHGTSTLEETAYFLHLTLPTERPVVLVGAMRPSSGLSQDGDLILLNAVRVAFGLCSGRRGERLLEARERGVDIGLAVGD